MKNIDIFKIKEGMTGKQVSDLLDANFLNVLSRVEQEVDSSKPNIGENGNWFIGETDTNVEAKGKAPLMQFDEEKKQIQYGYDGVNWNDIVSADEFTVNNKPDDEDIVSKDDKLKFADKKHDELSFSGMGRKHLRKNIVTTLDSDKNILTQDMINEPNTIYHIQYDYDLNGLTINIPENSVLKFEGGSLENGCIIGKNTIISACLYHVFKNIQFETESVFVNDWYAEWFGANEKRKDNDIPINYALQQLKKLKGSSLLYLSKMYHITDTVIFTEKVSVKGTSRNMHYNTATPKTKNGCGLFAEFTNANAWIVDTETTLDLQYNSVDIVSPTNIGRITGVTYSDFDIVTAAETPVYGGLRIINMYNSNVNNVAIFGTWIGIFSSWIWCNTFTNLWIESYYAPVYLAKDCTTTVWINPYLLKPAYGAKEVNFEKPLIYLDKSLPPYTNIDDTAIILEGVEGSDRTNVTMLNPIIQGYKCVAIGHRYTLTLYHPYIEMKQLMLTIIWGYDAIVTIDGYEGGIKGTDLQSSYDFGTHNGKFIIKNFPYNRCYDPYNKDVKYSNGYRYVVDMNKSHDGFYYDSIKLDSEGRFVSGKKTVYKYFLNTPSYFDLNANANSDFVWQKVNVGQNVDWNDLLNRTKYDKEINLMYLSYVDLQTDVVIKNKTINIYYRSPMLDYYPQLFKITATLKLHDCKLVNHTNIGKSGFVFIEGVTPFEIKGKLHIIDGGGYEEVSKISTMFKLVGNDDIDVLWENAYQYVAIKESLIDITEFKKAYRIRIIKEDGKILELSNHRGAFEKKPIDPNTGFQYFCTDRKTTEGTENGIMIHYKGNGVWVDSLGRVVL